MNAVYSIHYKFLNMTRSILLFLSLFMIWSFSVNGQKKQSMIIYPDEVPIILSSTYNFNQTVKKSVDFNGVKVSKIAITIDRPTHLYYINSSINEGRIFFDNYSSIVMPGDSLIFIDEKRVKYSPFNSQLIDSLLSMDLTYDLLSTDRKKLIAQQSLKDRVQNIETTYQQNDEKIGGLKLTDSLKKVLTDFNYILKCKSIVGIKTQSLTVKEQKTIDSLYRNISVNYKQLEQINSPFAVTIYHRLMARYLTSLGIPDDKLIDNFDKLSRFPFLTAYLKLSLYGANESSPKERDKLFVAIEAAKLANSELTKLYLELKNKRPVFENKILPNLDQIWLTNQANQKISLATILAKHKGKVLLVDFWASWCTPCRSELPTFVKYRTKYKNQHISFVNFSIDVDQKVADWEKAIIEEKEMNNPNQFRLIDWKNSTLTKLIDLRTIPRYIIIDDKGKILNSEFLRPSDPRFEEELKKYIPAESKK
ncbi:TlpA disulfide reductase family protein [Pedobacter sp. Hv1]|uniref:TlpA family protein disulfide reductase n=1 Tax=Pedobacter sp. Hv1 TaxID=1740090 RepID=UPI0006D891D0|nr:TlpA disulfide reductase family protein [Pedobacter sp. Hv1]KQB99546.1 hypothetical protein AQF98_18490 [Pedobacter sp. Hv1]